MFRLHRWLLDSASPHGDGMKVGKLVVGISTLIFVIALVVGSDYMVAAGEEKFSSQPVHFI